MLRDYELAHLGQQDFLFQEQVYSNQNYGFALN